MNAPEIRTLTVTELNTLAKDYLENLPLFRNISVKGELSNVTLHRTGHIYFSIKDEGATSPRSTLCPKTGRRSQPREG